VVLNLILNAPEAMGSEAMGSVEAEPRELLISTAQHHTGVLVAVRDSGPGMDPAHLERAFDAFTPRRPTVSGWGYRFAGPSSTPMGAGYGQRRMSHAAPYFSSPCLPCRWDLEFGAKRSVAGKQHLVRTRLCEPRGTSVACFVPDLRRVSHGRIGTQPRMPLATQAIVENPSQIGRPVGGAGMACTHDMRSRSR
jgi:hypothetical protein